MDNKITIKYPDKLPDALQLSRDEFEEEAKLAMAIKLFEMKKLSSGTAASLAGLNRIKFLFLLGTHGISMINYDPEELRDDFENA